MPRKQVLPLWRGFKVDRRDWRDPPKRERKAVSLSSPGNRLNLERLWSALFRCRYGMWFVQWMTLHKSLCRTTLQGIKLAVQETGAGYNSRSEWKCESDVQAVWTLGQGVVNAVQASKRNQHPRTNNWRKFQQNRSDLTAILGPGRDASTVNVWGGRTRKGCHKWSAFFYLKTTPSRIERYGRICYVAGFPRLDWPLCIWMLWEATTTGREFRWCCSLVAEKMESCSLSSAAVWRYWGHRLCTGFAFRFHIPRQSHRGNCLCYDHQSREPAMDNKNASCEPTDCKAFRRPPRLPRKLTQDSRRAIKPRFSISDFNVRRRVSHDFLFQ